MKTDGIIFDIDGTLWDATPRIREAYNIVIQNDGRLKKEITLEQMQKMMGLIIPDIGDALFSELEKEERLKLVNACCDYECEYLKTNGGILYPHVLETLKVLAKKYPLYIVSNCQDGYIESMFFVHDMEKYFRDSECSGRTGLPKADNLKMIVERNQLLHPIYIGDTAKDEEACLNANIPFIYAAYGFGEASTYTAKIDTFQELEKIFE